jgi:hypothetical protein
VILIIGTESYRSMPVPLSTKDALSKRRIKLITKNIKKACALFDGNIKNNTKIEGSFHLTC